MTEKIIRPQCDKFTAIVNLVGGAVGQDSKGIITYHDDQTPPSEEVIATELKRLEDEYDAQEYARNRKIEYNALNQFEMQFDDEVNGTTTWKDAIEAIKTKYPKG